MIAMTFKTSIMKTSITYTENGQGFFLSKKKRGNNHDLKALFPSEYRWVAQSEDVAE